MTDETQLSNEEPDAAAEAKAAAAEAKAAAAERKAAEAAAKAQAKADAKAAKDAAREEAKAAKAAERAAAKEAAAAARQRPEQNGIKMPREGGKCWQAWQLMSEVSTHNQAPATLADVLPLAEERGLNLGNVRAEYGQWCKFYGVPRTGRRKAAEPAPAEETAPAEA